MEGQSLSRANLPGPNQQAPASSAQSSASRGFATAEAAERTGAAESAEAAETLDEMIAAYKDCGLRFAEPADSAGLMESAEPVERAKSAENADERMAARLTFESKIQFELQLKHWPQRACLNGPDQHRCQHVVTYPYRVSKRDFDEEFVTELSKAANRMSTATEDKVELLSLWVYRGCGCVWRPQPLPEFGVESSFKFCRENPHDESQLPSPDTSMGLDVFPSMIEPGTWIRRKIPRHYELAAGVTDQSFCPRSFRFDPAILEGDCEIHRSVPVADLDIVASKMWDRVLNVTSAPGGRRQDSIQSAEESIGQDKTCAKNDEDERNRAPVKKLTLIRKNVLHRTYFGSSKALSQEPTNAFKSRHTDEFLEADAQARNLVKHRINEKKENLSDFMKERNKAYGTDPNRRNSSLERCLEERLSRMQNLFRNDDYSTDEDKNRPQETSSLLQAQGKLNENPQGPQGKLVSVALRAKKPDENASPNEDFNALLSEDSDVEM